MDKTPSVLKRTSPHAPLAHDANGNPIALPEGAAAWRIRRQTGGRPRLLLDAAKQPMTFPLHYTVADAEDILAPGNYRLDVVDEDGEALDVTVPLTIGGHRNAEPAEPEDDSDGAVVVVPTTLPTTASDTRLVLEANIRATQMAFLHNERTLATGLRMAETLRDGVQVLAQAQAGWITSISSARGFFRNAPPPPPALPASRTTKDDDDDDGGYDDKGEEGYYDDDGGGGGAPSTLMQQLSPVIAQLAPVVAIAAQKGAERLIAWATKPHDPNEPSGGLELGDLLDWRRPALRKARAIREQAQRENGVAHRAALPDHDGRAGLAEEAPRPTAPGRAASSAAPVDGVSVLPLSLLTTLPPEALGRFVQVRALLSAEEQGKAMQLLQAIPQKKLVSLVPAITAMSVEDLAAFLRKQIAAMTARPGGRRAADAGQPDGDGGSEE